MKRIKVITGYSKDAQFWAQVGKHIGYIPRQIKTPYAYSPVHEVILWNNKPVVHAETAHRRYEVFEVPESMIKKTEKECY